MDHRPVRVAAALAVAFACARGTSNDGNGSVGRPPDAGQPPGPPPPPPPPPVAQVALDLQTSGNGMVRGAGADCRGSCHVMYNAGAAVHLEAVPDSGYAFSGWSGACSGATDCSVRMDADVSVRAT